MQKPDGDPGEVEIEIEIRDVWEHNLDEEFALIRTLVDSYPLVAMDTEFPGLVVRPIFPFPSVSARNYHTLKANVDLLKLIQLGLALVDPSGRLPAPPPHHRPCLWQFNFREFDHTRDVSAGDSVELLRQSGIDFSRNREQGVPVKRFAELLMSSGVVLNPDVEWITFHSGYDFGYLVKALTCRDLPETREGFFELVDSFFPVLYDIKHLMKYCNNLHGGLSRLAELLGVKRIGISHQAGSDSLLTASSFFKLREVYFGGDVARFAGVLFGLEGDNSSSNAATVYGSGYSGTAAASTAAATAVDDDANVDVDSDADGRIVQ